MNTYTFAKENGDWYIDLKGELRAFNKSDLALLEGSAPLLDFLSMGKKRITLTIDSSPFEQAIKLELIQIGNDNKGGGYYQLFNTKGAVLLEELWLCDVLLFVFGDIPDVIYLKREKPVSIPSVDPKRIPDHLQTGQQINS